VIKKFAELISEIFITGPIAICFGLWLDKSISSRIKKHYQSLNWPHRCHQRNVTGPGWRDGYFKMFWAWVPKLLYCQFNEMWKADGTTAAYAEFMRRPYVLRRLSVCLWFALDNRAYVQLTSQNICSRSTQILYKLTHEFNKRRHIAGGESLRLSYSGHVRLSSNFQKIATIGNVTLSGTRAQDVLTHEPEH